MKKERPEIVSSKTIKTKVSCGSLFITIGFDEQGEPLELFINGSKMGTCRANLEALARLNTLLFAYRVNPEEIADQLSKIRCPACMQQIAKKEGTDKINYPWSCADAISKIILRFKKEV